MNQKVDKANHFQYNSKRSSNTELIANPGEKRVEILIKTFHVNVWQKPLQYCKVISLQLIKISEKIKI